MGIPISLKSGGRLLQAFVDLKTLGRLIKSKALFLKVIMDSVMNLFFNKSVP